MKEIIIETTQAKEMVDITMELQRVVGEEGWQNGVLTAFCLHTTAGLTINENSDPDVPRDMLMHLQKLIPQATEFRHSEGNSDAHIMSSLVGASVQLIVENERIVLGTWQSVFLCEFDGGRRRKVALQFNGE